MKRSLSVAVLVLLFSLLLIGSVQADTDNGSACWGQASAVFAHMGEMGLHSSEQPTPRLGLRNLARALYDQGLIPDDSMQSLGAFVVSVDPELTVEACM
jgi:hypothetical protein